MLSRTSTGALVRERFPRHRRQVAIASLIGSTISDHDLTDEVRQRSVCLYWAEIAGERLAGKTFPIALANGVLSLTTVSSAWVHEMQFHKRPLIEKINEWIAAQYSWLGRPVAPIVTDIRCMLGSQRREVLVDPEYADRLRARQLRRMRPRERVAPIVEDAERDALRDAIRAETANIEDEGLRAAIEQVRLLWNR